MQITEADYFPLNIIETYKAKDQVKDPGDQKVADIKAARSFGMLQALGLQGNDVEALDKNIKRFDLPLTMKYMIKRDVRKGEPIKVSLHGRPYDFKPAHLEQMPGEQPVVLGLLRGSSEAFICAMRLVGVY